MTVAAHRVVREALGDFASREMTPAIRERVDDDLAVMMPPNDTDAAVDRAHESVLRVLDVDGHYGGRDFDWIEAELGQATRAPRRYPAI
jgi:hypothetical protein